MSAQFEHQKITKSHCFEVRTFSKQKVYKELSFAVFVIELINKNQTSDIGSVVEIWLCGAAFFKKIAVFYILFPYIFFH